MMKKLVVVGISSLVLFSMNVVCLDSLLMLSHRCVTSGQALLFQQIGKYAPSVHHKMQAFGSPLVRNPYVQLVGIGMGSAACWYAWSHYANNQACKDKKYQECENKDFASLAQLGDKFCRDMHVPIGANNISCIGKNNPAVQAQIVAHAQGTRYFMHVAVFKELIPQFLIYKCEHGSKIERAFYQNMTRDQLIKRLVMKRPIVFTDKSDWYKLRDGTTNQGGFEKIGTEQESAPLLLADYLSNDEAPLSALIGISGSAHCINNGYWPKDNDNQMRKSGDEGSFEEEVVAIGQVGARFELPHAMESQHMVIDPERNTSENGYGCNNTSPSTLKVWEKFYGKKFLTYAEVDKESKKKSDQSEARYLPFRSQWGRQCYLDMDIYKRRMRLIVEPFLHEANERGKKANKLVYLHVSGWGTGVWSAHLFQKQLIIDVFDEVLQAHQFAQISNIDFSWFDTPNRSPNSELTCGNVHHNGTYTKQGNDIRIRFSRRNFADKLQGSDTGKLLVAGYPWDGRSKAAGNEYWHSRFAASLDPVFASSSTIGELQNPEVNPHLLTNPVKLYCSNKYFLQGTYVSSGEVILC
jgi:hypothetical protein